MSNRHNVNYSFRQAYKNKAIIKGLLTFLGIMLICGTFTGDAGFLILLLILAASGYIIGSMCPDNECLVILAKATPVVAVILALITGVGISAVIGGAIGGIIGLFTGKGVAEQKYYDGRLTKNITI